MTFDAIPGPARVSPRTPLPVVEEPQDDGYYDEQQTRTRWPAAAAPAPAEVVPLPLSQQAAADYAVGCLYRLARVLAHAGLDQWASWAEAGATCLAFDFQHPEVPA